VTVNIAERIKGLVDELGESPSLEEQRVKSYAKYEQLPYERSQLFVKNFEKMNEDPSEFDVLFERGKASLPSGLKYAVASLGPRATVGELPGGVEFFDAKTRGAPLLQLPLSEDEDKMYYLNGALRNSLQRFTVRDRVRLESPLIRLSVSPPGKVATFRRTEIEVGEGSKLLYIDRVIDYPGASEEPALLNDVTDVRMRPNSALTYVTLSTGRRERVTHDVRFVLEGGAKLTCVSWYADSPYVRARAKVTLKGEGSDVDLFWGGYPKVSSRYDYLAVVEHLARSTRGYALQRGLAKGRSRMLLKGLMIIRETATNADSHLSQHILLLSKDSFANAIPGLEIETNELKAKHSASVSQPDEDQLFYLMSRGLTREESVMSVAGGYLAPLAVNIPDPSAREALEYEVEKALRS
jgi:Fe-S cluster assembly scaffold protein SufB